MNDDELRKHAERMAGQPPPPTGGELRQVAADALEEGRTRCVVCGVWTTHIHRWDDGLTYAGGRCREHARPYAEAQDQQRRREVEWWEAFAAALHDDSAYVDAAVAEARRLRAEYDRERQLPPDQWTHVQPGHPDYTAEPLPNGLYDAFRSFQARMVAQRQGAAQRAAHDASGAA